MKATNKKKVIMFTTHGQQARCSCPVGGNRSQGENERISTKVGKGESCEKEGRSFGSLQPLRP